jgi:hypothetical protein
MLLGGKFFGKGALTTLSLLTPSGHICNYLLMHKVTEYQAVEMDGNFAAAKQLERVLSFGI